MRCRSVGVGDEKDTTILANHMPYTTSTKCLPKVFKLGCDVLGDQLIDGVALFLKCPPGPKFFPAKVIGLRLGEFHRFRRWRPICLLENVLHCSPIRSGNKHPWWWWFFFWSLYSTVPWSLEPLSMLLSFFVDILHQETLRYKAELMPLSASRMSEEVTFSTGDVDVCRWVVPVAPGRFNSGNPKMKFSPLQVPLLFCQVWKIFSPYQRVDVDGEPNNAGFVYLNNYECHCQ